MKIYLDSIGCRLNQAEIESYARQLHLAGHELVGTPAEADLAIVNTCAVTAAAASDSRQKARQLARQGVPGIVLTGCWATLAPEEAAHLPAVQRVISNQEKDALVSTLFGLPTESFDLEPLQRVPVPGARLRTRLFLKVQDGCDNRCTFCITTVARGQSRSRTLAQVLQEISQSAEVQEIVLTGVHLAAWGADLTPPQKLADLVRAVLAHCAVPRLRLSSLEPWDLSLAFFELWQDPRLCRHLHLPLQSGSAATLRRMARRITPEAYLDLITAARRMIPGVAITTDLIAGFPGESEAEFEESLAFVRQADFAGGHVFTYSARPGTAAARMPAQVPLPVRKERSARLRQALEESSRRFRQGLIGQQLPVLWESAARLGPDGWELHGLTDNYLRVQARAPRQLWNQITLVHIEGLTDSGAYGALLLGE